MGAKRKYRYPYSSNTYGAYKYKYDYYLYLKLILIREGRYVKELATCLGLPERDGCFISTGRRKLSKYDLQKIANEFHINMKMWASKSLYVYALFEADFSEEERNEVLRQRIWEPDKE